MPRRMLTAIALLVLSQSVAQAQAGTVKQQGGTSGAVAKAAITKMWDDLITAGKRGDAAALGAFYTDDAMIIDPSMPTAAGRANIIDLYKSMMAGMKFIDNKITTTSLEVFGDVAVQNGTYTVTLQEKGKAPANTTARFEAVLRNVNGKWLIHRDITIPMPPAKK